MYLEYLYVVIREDIKDTWKNTPRIACISSNYMLSYVKIYKIRGELAELFPVLFLQSL